VHTCLQPRRGKEVHAHCTRAARCVGTWKHVPNAPQPRGQRSRRASRQHSACPLRERRERALLNSCVGACVGLRRVFLVAMSPHARAMSRYDDGGYNATTCMLMAKGGCFSPRPRTCATSAGRPRARWHTRSHTCTHVAIREHKAARVGHLPHWACLRCHPRTWQRGQTEALTSRSARRPHGERGPAPSSPQPPPRHHQPNHQLCFVTVSLTPKQFFFVCQT
jgi:hypothetical protein